VLVGAALYFTQVVVPATPPLFMPTPTHTRSPESFTSEAEAFFKEGKLTQAIDAYKQAIQADPKNPSNYVALARAQVFAGNYTEAKITAEDALILNPNNSMSHAVKAWALDKLEDYLEAEASVKQALDLDPNNALAHAYLAEILIDKGDFGAAMYCMLPRIMPTPSRNISRRSPSTINSGICIILSGGPIVLTNNMTWLLKRCLKQ
jgi:Tfp pilus assembly protein PilF